MDAADTGIGIAPEDSARIFEPFVQVGPSTPFLSPEALGALPVRLRQDPEEAVVALDATRIDAVLARIAPGNPDVAALLARHAGELAYSGILQARQSTGTGRQIREGE